VNFLKPVRIVELRLAAARLARKILGSKKTRFGSFEIP